MSKFKGKRMVEEDLIKKLQDLDPSGGTEYTAGTGIEISDENEISVDTDTIATKEYVDQHAGTTYTAGTGIDIDANNEISIDTTTVALKSELFSGDYDDLTNKPTIPAAQVNSDWNAASGVAQILNKPSIPSSASSTSTVTPTTETLTFTYSDSTTGTITVLTAVAVDTTTTLS